MPQDLPLPPLLEYDVSADANAEEDEAEKETEETEEEAEEIEDSEEEAVEEPVPAVAVTWEVERDLLKFIEDSLVPLASAGRELDSYNRFGLTLIFCRCGRISGVAPDALRALLSTHV